MKTVSTVFFFHVFALHAQVAVASGAEAVEEKASPAIGAAARAAGAGLGGRDTVNVALDYVRAKIQHEQQNNARLGAQLVETERNAETTQMRLGRAETKLQQVPRLKNRVATLLAEKSSALSQLSREWAREHALTAELQNVSLASQKRAQVLARAHKALAEERHAKADLARLLRNKTAANTEFSSAMNTLHHDYDSLQQSQHTKDLELGRSRSFISHMRDSLHGLQDAEKQDQARLSSTLALKEQAVTRGHEVETKEEKLTDEMRGLKNEFSSLASKEKGVSQINEELSSSLAAEKVSLVRLLQEQTVEQKRENVEQAQEHNLRQEVLALRKKFTEVDALRQQEENQATTAKDDLFTAQSQVQDVKGTVPWLQAKVAQEKLQINNATSATNEALQERDSTRESLAAARKQIVYMEQQYAQIVKMVGKSVSEEAAGGADSSVIANLTVLMHSAVAETPVTSAGEQQDHDDYVDDDAPEPETAPPPPPMAAADGASQAGGLLNPSQPPLAAAPPPPRTSLRGLVGSDATPPDPAASLGFEQDSKSLEELLSGIIPDPAF